MERGVQTPVCATPASHAGRARWSLDWQGIGFVLLGVALGIGLIASTWQLYALQGSVVNVISLLPLGYAFSAGMVATVNPCGVLLLPSLVAYYLGQNVAAEVPAWRRAARALLLGAMATLGFVAIFTVVGLAVGVGGRALASLFPAGGFLVGLALTVVGLWLALSGGSLGIAAASRALAGVRLGHDLWSLFLFGIGYAVASLACTLPIFLVVVGSALATQGLVAAVGQFIAYALGMGTVLTIVILGATFFQGAVQRSLRRLVPYVHRAAASFLLGAGLFVMHYWLRAGGLLR